MTTEAIRLNRLSKYVRRPLEERFWEKVIVGEGSECWPWIASRHPGGYGMFRVGNRPHHAHVVAYNLAVGPVPEGLQIDHLCRVRHCVNPTHLEAVTQRVNIMRGNGCPALHARQTQCLRGHPFDEANTYRRSRNQRECRLCNRDRARRKAAL
jgi:hypothetical protein